MFPQVIEFGILKISQWEIDAHFTAPHVSRHGNHIAELSGQLWVKPVRLNSTWYCLPLIMHAWLCWTFDTQGIKGWWGRRWCDWCKSDLHQCVSSMFLWWWSFGGRRWLMLFNWEKWNTWIVSYFFSGCLSDFLNPDSRVRNTSLIPTQYKHRPLLAEPKHTFTIALTTLWIVSRLKITV